MKQVPNDASDKRWRVVPTLGATEGHVKLLQEKWNDVTPEKAIEVLDAKDIEVTNQKDKEGQLLKLRNLDQEVKDALGTRLAV